VGRAFSCATTSGAKAISNIAINAATIINFFEGSPLIAKPNRLNYVFTVLNSIATEVLHQRYPPTSSVR
jgi:hypothetical protein